MTNEDLRRRIEQLAYGAEVRAVAKIMLNGRAPRVGEVVDYAVDFLPASTSRYSKRKSVYRFAIEPWHLEAAALTVHDPS